MKRRALGMLLGLVLCAGLRLATAAEAESKVDWSAWRHLPVYHNGRIMPLDTFASSAVEIVCGRTDPILSLAGNLPADQLNSAELADAKKLFPGDKPRKFQDYELLLSWLLQPKEWEDIPFLHAAHDELLEILEIDPINAAGEHVKYVSPRQVEGSAAFFESVRDLAERHREAQKTGDTYRPTAVEKKVDALWQSLQLYRQLSFDPTLDRRAAERFGRLFGEISSRWQELEQQLSLFQQMDQKNALSEAIAQANAALGQINQAASSPSVGTMDLTGPTAELARATQMIAGQFAQHQRKLAEQPPADWTPDQVEKAQKLMGSLARETQSLAAQADELQVALFDNREWLRVVPALNAAALEKDRDTSDEAQPWLDLQTLLFGSPRALAAYPQQQVEEVQNAFRRLKETFDQREQRPNDFSADLGKFSASLAALGEAIEPLRDKLPIQGRDVALIEYTRYPLSDQLTRNEVRYNTVDPFKWSWIISLAATFCFGVVFIGMRKRMFWLGLAILAVGLVWSLYGFYLRISITGWAPVTNMYETVIFVPFFVTSLGAWFALLPLTWPGLTAAWRLTAMPWTWECTPLTSEHTTLLSRNVWPERNRASLVAWVLLAARVALGVLTLKVLAIDPYAAGGRTIVNLLPNVDQGHTLPDFNDLMTWGVGLCVLVPTVWYVPRVILSALLGVVMVPLALRRGDSRSMFEQVYARWPFGLAATSIAFFGSFIAWYSPVLDSSFTPLQPVLRDNFWLLIHVLTIVSSYGAGALALGLGEIALAYYLFGKYREPAGAVAGQLNAGPRRPPEATATLAGYQYKAIQVAVLLLAAGTILGALWADVAWGRFWGWDPKEVWALISLLIYIAVLHGRFAGWVGNFGLTAGTVFGATAIIMSWYGVNFVLGKGLHSYGFGESSQGQWYVLIAVLLNWGFLGMAALRYERECDPWKRRRPPGPPSARTTAVQEEAPTTV
jgi:ABC-type transport system involved in cytochrome c biogenesis permease subunit